MNLTEFILEHEARIRMAFFFGTLIIMGVWEIIAPRRALTVSKAIRWLNNIGIVFLNSLIIRLIFPAAAVGVAITVNVQGWGLFNYYAVPSPVSIILSIVLLDFIIYLQHVLVHAVPVLWRLHRMHHADPDFDVTTGSRFHPIEILLSILIKFAAIAVLGTPVIAVILFEIILNISSMFNHSNIRLPSSLDKFIRLFIVTPDMHRVHHSIYDHEANSNFGFCIPWWDRLFGTYKAQPDDGHKGMTIGIHTYREPHQVSWITGMLLLPFKGKVSGYAINRRQWNNRDET